VIEEIATKEKYCPSSNQSHSMFGDVLVVRICLSREKSGSDTGNKNKCCGKPGTQYSRVYVKDSMPQIIAESPIIERAMKVHHHNTDESDSPRDV